MKKHISGFAQFINECGCAGNGQLPEAGDYGLNQDGTSIKNETDGMVMEEDETGEDGSSDMKTITITARDSEGNLEKLINLIKDLGNQGHSFSIVVDPDSDNEETIGWDGDGGDHIESIDVDGGSEEEEEGNEPDFDDEDSEEGDGDEDDYENDEDADEDDVNEAKKEKKRPGSEKDGSYPITDLKSLKAAIHAYGRSKDKAKTKAHIKSRAKALGLTKHVSNEWK